MEHNFNVEIAVKHGVNVAIFLNNMAFWIHKNISNNKHCYKGQFWTYNSQEAFTKIFPYWNRKSIRTVIEYCIKNNLIIKDNFNDTKYDRTMWYTFTDEGLDLFEWLKKDIHSIGRKGPMDSPYKENPLAEKGQCITDIKTDIKTDIIKKENFNVNKKTKSKKCDIKCSVKYFSAENNIKSSDKSIAKANLKAIRESLRHG